VIIKVMNINNVEIMLQRVDRPRTGEYD